MGASAKAAVFDVDGVLIDSLRQHLQICRDKAREFGLAIRIPDADEFRSEIARGLKVSPMIEFFRALGFPENYAQLAVEDYEKYFMRLYGPRVFPGVKDMLAALKRAGMKLGLVTSNTRANVVPALGNAIDQFEESCVFFFDEYSPGLTKSECLVEVARALSFRRSDCIYIGDQPADYAAARNADCQFLGVSYGWGILRNAPFDVADSVADIPKKLVGFYAHT